MDNEETLIRDGYVGKRPRRDGKRGYEYLFVDISVRHRENGTTIDHQPIAAYDSLSICGTVWLTRVRRGDCISAGRVLEDWRGSELLESPINVSKLRAVWRRWHLNDMRPNCAHQSYVGPRPEDLPSIPKCPETGYRYGHAWLVEPLPDDVLSWVRAVAAKIGD